MSRRHHGRPNRNALGTAEGPRRGTGVESRPLNAPEDAQPRPMVMPQPREAATLRPPEAESVAPVRAAAAATIALEAPGEPAALPERAPESTNGADQRMGQCTAPQLRRFIKSRPYVPMHELRRRFGIIGDDDDVTPVRLDPGWIYVGLPNHEGRLLGDLLRTGEIGYELSLDPRTPIVIGVYPMRPIARN
jgi:hypothetical protein